MSTFQSLPGFREFYPEDCAARNGLFKAWRGAARRAGFVEYDAPILEPLELFTEKSGEEIRTQLFEFTDKGGRNVALRPEMTPSLARLVGARAGSLRRPLKWFSIGEQFRYEKPQKGRGRSFYQFNADILGEPGVAADAECIALLIESLRSCGLNKGEFEVRISDRTFWFLYLRRWGLNDEQIPSVLSIIDKMERERDDDTEKKLKPFFGENSMHVLLELKRPNAILESVIESTSTLSARGPSGEWETVKTPDPIVQQKLRMRMAEQRQLKDNLNQLGLEGFYRFDQGIIRGLAYYTGFVFEAFQTVGTARALAGGGRYDNLLQKLGGVNMPAVGFAIGDMTVSDLLEELKRPLGEVDKPDVYLVIGGEKERGIALGLVGKLRTAGLSVDYPLKETGFGKQFKAADQCGARLAIVVGEDEVKNGVVKIQDMKSRGEMTAANDDGLIARVREILASGLPTT